MPVLKTAAERAAFPTICPIHKIPFVQFECIESTTPYTSMGCPNCVAKIREDVQREFAVHRKWGRIGPNNSNAKVRANARSLQQMAASAGDISRKVKTGS